MNEQHPEHPAKAGALLQVHSIFSTIQGEGPFCGVPAIFVRLAGCNLQCPGCDTDYTSTRIEYSSLRVVREVQKLAPAGLVVITGGEPFRQDIGHLLRLLTQEGFYVQIETNGTLAPPPNVNYVHIPHFRTGVFVVVSPKTGRVHPMVTEAACAYKYVLTAGQVDEHDGLPLAVLGHPVFGHVARPPHGWHRPVYVQPADEKDEFRNLSNLKAAMESCMDHGHTLQLQVHKIIGLE